VRAARAAALEGMPAGLAVLRRASLRPRRLRDHVSARLLAVPYGVAVSGLGLLVLQLSRSVTGERRLFAPLAHAAVGVVFLLLYAAWLKDEARGGQVLGVERDETEVEAQAARETRARVRRIYAAQLALVAAFAVLSNVVAGLDWSASGTRVAVALSGLLAAPVGVLGCAFALSSGASRRQLTLAERAPRTRLRAVVTLRRPWEG
jgi:hypothetical protein